MKQLNSDEGLQLLRSMRETVNCYLDEIDLHVGVEQSPAIDTLLDHLSRAREHHVNDPDDVLNDIFVLEVFTNFLRSYGKLWRQIANGNYSDSWTILQDAHDALRQIRKFSALSLDSLIEQLHALESLYPYKIFASCGFIVEQYDCSICGHDIDSFECNHRKGELYRGQLAYGIAHNIVNIDHIALVKNPVDKRCVITIPNDAPGFSGIEFLRQELNRKAFSVSNFRTVMWDKVKKNNPDYVRVGRNEACRCQSGKKFKHCCIDKAVEEIDHAEIIFTQSVFPRLDI